jgi:alpha-mannosidase
VLCEIPGGMIERPADGEEHVHNRWLLLREEDRETTMAVINNGQNGFDFRNGELRLSVLRSAAYCHEQGFRLAEYPAPKFMDQGVHEIRLLVAVGKFGDLRKSVTALADWLSAPPAALAHLPVGSMTDSEAKRKAVEDSPKNLLSITPRSVRMLACKQSGDGKSLIVRLQEIAGEITPAQIHLQQPNANANIVFKPQEIKTVRYENDGSWREVGLIDER